LDRGPFRNEPLGVAVSPRPQVKRVRAICDFVHNHIQFGYEHARATKTAWEAYQERRGVCRDYAHLAIAFCRCMNIPARCCTGYLGDIGMPPPYGPMDFAGWVRGLSRRAMLEAANVWDRLADFADRQVNLFVKSIPPRRHPRP
jgi:hypothetical protein